MRKNCVNYIDRLDSSTGKMGVCARVWPVVASIHLRGERTSCPFGGGGKTLGASPSFYRYTLSPTPRPHKITLRCSSVVATFQTGDVRISVSGTFSRSKV